MKPMSTLLSAATVLAALAVAALAACQPGFDYGAKKYEVKRLRTNLQAQPCSKDVFVPLVEVMTEAGDAAGVQLLTQEFTSACGELPWTPWLTFDYGGRLSKVKGLIEALDKEPCDKGRMVKLLDEMVGAGDYRGTLQKADAFFTKCGDLPRARWLTYAAHKRLSEYDAAIAEASKLVDSDRYDRDFWWCRGDAYFLKGDHQNALADHQEVQKLCPECTVGWQIADSTEKLGRPCDGIQPLQNVATRHPDASDIDKLNARIASLQQRPDCGGAPAPAKPTAASTAASTAVKTERAPANDARAPGRKR